MKILWIFLWGHHKTGLFLKIISMHFRVFLKVKIQNGIIFGVADVPDIPWGKQ